MVDSRGGTNLNTVVRKSAKIKGEAAAMEVVSALPTRFVAAKG